MATITITITDNPEDKQRPVSIQMAFDVAIDFQKPELFTEARRTALLMLEAALRASKGKPRVNEVR